MAVSMKVQPSTCAFHHPLPLSQMRTVNCHLLQRKDQQATNGIVHVIDGVLDPSRLRRTPLVDVVTQVTRSVHPLMPLKF